MKTKINNHLERSRLLLILSIGLFAAIVPAPGGNVYCAAQPAGAQSTMSTLSGTTVDQNGAVVVDVKVTAEKVDTATIHQTTTNGDGYFVITLLPPGRYKVTTQRQGFATVEITDVVLNIYDQRALRIRLSPSEIKEARSVEGIPITQTEDASVSTVVNRQFVENLPLNGRSYHLQIRR